MQMFQLEIENPCNENIQCSVSQEEPLYDFKMIQLKFIKTLYTQRGNILDRTEMKIEKLDVEFKDWMGNHMKMENGLIEFTVPKTGRYEIIQQSRSSNTDRNIRIGPAMGVTISLDVDLKKVENLESKLNNNFIFC